MGVSGRCWGNLGEAVEGLREAVGSCVEAAGGCGEVRGVLGRYGRNLGGDVEGLGESLGRPHGFQGCHGALGAYWQLTGAVVQQVAGVSQPCLGSCWSAAGLWEDGLSTEPRGWPGPQDSRPLPTACGQTPW